MSKAFTKETDNDDEEPVPEPIGLNSKNYVTPKGFADLQAELRSLSMQERPKLVETIRWAASNGDRSENADYIYGKRKLREIDRRLRYLTKRLENAEIVDPHKQQGLQKVFFGATVSYKNQGNTYTVKIVGIDEADMANKKVSWLSPLAKALIKSEVGDQVALRTPQGKEILEIITIQYEIES